jgi:hypothetical protein
MAINPLQKPIDYLGMVPQVDIGQGIEKLGAAFSKRQESIDTEAKAAQYRADLDGLINNPTDENFIKFSMDYPKQFQATESARKAAGENRVNNTFNQGNEVAEALKNKKPEVALSKLDILIEASNNSGESPYIYEQIRDTIKAGDETTALASANFALMYIDPERFKKNVEAKAAFEQAPSILAKSVADAADATNKAKISLATATTAEAKAKAELDLAEANAKEKQVKAKYAEQQEQADLKAKRNTSDLTKQQIAQSAATTKNLNTTGKILSLDFQAALNGLPIPSKQTGATVKTATEDERKAAGWLSQATNAYSNMLNTMYTKEGKKTGAEEESFGEAIGLGKLAQGPERQKFVQAASSLSEALLRAATGAGVNKDEAKQKVEELTPTYFDEPENIKQKLAAIPIYLQSLQSRAGRAAPQDFKIPQAPAEVVTIDGKTYTRPATFTNEQWTAYKKEQGG